MAGLEHYRTFVAIIEAGSLTAAARRLDCSLQTVSRSLIGLEAEIGAKLVHRTTRRLQPTPAGTAFYERIRIALREIDEARSDVMRGASEIAGLFRVGASVQFAPRYVVPTTTAFVDRYPGVEVDLILSDALMNLIEHRLDVVVRIGEPASSSLKSRLLGKLRRVVVAAPQYLARHGRPSTPADLREHSCVVRTFGPEGDSWPVTEGAAVTKVAVKGRFRCNDAAGANAAVLQGAGVGLAPLWQVRSEIDQGLLEVLLPDHEPPPIPVHALWLENAAMPVRTRMFVDMLRHRMASERI
ncbi:LysR family transcriptional regulator [Sphingomonas sp. MA1305]|uniref:LysR family transcriptional regulator n=1 Tax=Sphingomonas sp. MA1305 TaxID=2479204 RepID=UPI0018DFF935|nr:LysR family transcriptional regulator [Sphingomonas sp. MA1305]MBI0475615.1 LysR family transcriptional regulator [Sphingomonas sp. MA1305]